MTIYKMFTADLEIHNIKNGKGKVLRFVVVVISIYFNFSVDRVKYMYHEISIRLMDTFQTRYNFFFIIYLENEACVSSQ